MVKHIILIAFAIMGAFAYAQPVQQEGLQKINGTSLYIKIVGSGEPLVIIHGGPGMNHTYFLPHLGALEKKYKVVYYDQRCSGHSAITSPDSTTLSYFASDIEAIRKYLGVEKITLLAHSWGAIPAVKYALSYPDKINRIIFSNAVPLSHSFDAEMMESQKKKMTIQDSTDRVIIMGSRDFKSGKAEGYQKLLLLSFRHSFYKPSNITSLHISLPPNYTLASKSLYNGLAKDLGQYDWYDQVKSLPFPVLIIHGQSDAIPLAADQKLQAAFPKATLSIFKKSGHFTFIEESNRFYRVINDFMSGK